MERIALGSLLLLLATGSASTTPAPALDDVEERLTLVASTAPERESLAGLSVAIHVGDDRLFGGGWGYVDAARGVTAEEDSTYRAGGILPTLLSVLVLQRVGAGELSLETPVRELVPELASVDAAVTLEHVLRQTSGLQDYEPFLPDDTEDVRPDALLARVAALPLDFEPGSCFEPSPTNALLLGRILESDSDRTVAELLSAALFGPLEMEDTTFCWTSAPLREHDDASVEFAGALYRYDSPWMPFDGAALCTTAADLTRFARGVATGAVLDGDELELLTSSGRLPDGSATHFTTGLSRTDLEDFECLSFGGGAGGSRVHLAWFPREDVTVAVLASDADAPVMAIGRSLARVIFDLPDPDLGAQPLDLEAALRCAGRYQVGCTVYNVVFEDEHLVYEPPTDERWVLVPIGANTYVARDNPEIRLVFLIHEGEELANAVHIVEHGSSRIATRSV